MSKIPLSELSYLTLTRGGVPYSPVIGIAIDHTLDNDMLKEALRITIGAVPDLRKCFMLEHGEVEWKSNHVDIDEIYKSTHAQEASFDESITAVLNEPYDPYKDPLFYLYNIKLKEKQYILVKWHHSLFDAISSVYMLEEIFRTYLHLTGNASAHIAFANQHLTLREFIRRFGKVRDNINAKPGVLFRLKGIMTLLGSLFRRKAHGKLNVLLDEEDKIRFKSLELGSVQTSFFSKLKDIYSFTENDMLLAILTTSLQQWDRQSRKTIRIFVPSDIRPLDHHKLLGNLITPSYVYLKQLDKKGFLELTQSIHRKMQKNKGSTSWSAAIYMLDSMKKKLEELKRLTQNSFEVSNMQFTNLSNFLETALSPVMEVTEARFCAPPKSGLAGVFSGIKCRDSIFLGMAFVEKRIPQRDIDNLFRIIQEETEKVKKNLG